MDNGVQVGRRAVLHAAAWSASVLVASVAAPLAAASQLQAALRSASQRTLWSLRVLDDDTVLTAISGLVEFSVALYVDFGGGIHYGGSTSRMYGANGLL